MTATFYTKDNPVIQKHLSDATVGIPNKDKNSGKTTYNPYVAYEGRILVAADTWNPPNPEQYEMRIVPSYEVVEAIGMIVASAEISFRLRGSASEADWSVYFRNYGSAPYQNTNQSGQVYNLSDAVEKAVTGAMSRVLGAAGIGISANEEDMDAPQQQTTGQRPPQSAPQAPQQQPVAKVDPWPMLYTKLTDAQRASVTAYILKTVGCTSEDLQALVDAATKKNKSITAQQIYEQAAEELGEQE